METKVLVCKVSSPEMQGGVLSSGPSRLLPCTTLMDKRATFSAARRSSFSGELVREALSLNKLRFSSLGLYGRDSEMAQLQEAYNRVRRRRNGPLFGPTGRRVGGLPVAANDDDPSPSSPELVLVSGRSGTGKSALAQSLSGTVRRTGSLFASGKFDMRQRSEPYTAFISAFSGLCNLLSAENSSVGPSDSSSALRIRCAIRDAVGSEGALLMEIVPNLPQVVGEGHIRSRDKASTDAEYKGMRSRFNFLLRRFLRAICVHKPLVLVLDDLQWADTASLELFKTLVTDRDNPSLLIIGSYRDNEVEDGVHPLAKCLREIGEPEGGTSNAVTTVSLGNLDVEAINELISNLLTSTLEKTRGLAEIVHKKTYGNAFAIKHFLESLHDEGILHYCLGTLAWKWDEDKVRSRTSVTDNVAEMMIFKIRNKLSRDVRDVLQVAACLGWTFDLSTLLLVAKKVQSEFRIAQCTGQGSQQMNGTPLSKQQRLSVVQCLDLCIEEGLLEKNGESCYCFAHDQILDAAFSLIPEDSRDSLQFRIGEALLENLTEPDLEKNLFLVVGMLNHGVELISMDAGKCEQLSRLNLQAGSKAMKASAFGPAAVYLKTGIGLLGPDCWRDQTDLSLELFSTAAKAECCNGHLEDMKRYLDGVLKQNLSIREKFSAYFTQIHSMCFIQDKALEAVNVSLYVLAQLGVHFPRNCLKSNVVKGFIKTKYMLKGLPISDLSSRPAMEDETRLQVMQMMDALFTTSYSVKPTLFPLVALKMVQWSVRHGISKFSATAFATYGVLLCSVVGDMKKGNEFANVAVTLLKRFDAKEVESRVLLICNACISHWVVPAHLSHKRSLHTYEVGMQTGDIIFAMLSIRAYCQLALIIGKPLPLIDAEIKSYSEQMKDYKQNKALSWLLPVWQFALNLMGRSHDPVVLTGEVMQQEDLLKQSEENCDGFLRSAIKCYQFWAAFYFGDLELAGNLVKELKQKEITNWSTPLTWRNALFEGLTAFALARKTKSWRWRTHAAKVTSKVRQWVKNGNINCKHVLLMFEAEMAALKGKSEKAREKYNAAISITSRFGFIHDRALANERAGEFMLETGDKYFGAHHLSLAYQSYSSWGATAKAEHLHNKHSQLFKGDDMLLLLGEDIKRRWSAP